MNEPETNPPIDANTRSPLLMRRDNSALLVIDVQEKLLPHITGADHVEWNIGRLIDGAAALKVPVFATEQYPRGLGPTVASIRDRITAADSPLPEKTMFSCRECEAILQHLQDAGIRNLVLCGIETHVCVGQTAIDFLSFGLDIFLCVDAVGSRTRLDHETAIRRMESSGVTTVTTESVLFEWCEAAGSPEFKTISQLVRQTSPGA